VSEGSTLPDPLSAAELHDIGMRDDELRRIDTGETRWRLHRTVGPHVLGWNAFRHFGPELRFDPHLPPRSEHLDRAVWYGASTPGAALAEAFQVDRTIDRRRGRPHLTGLSFTRALSVLDLAVDSPGASVTRAGARSRYRQRRIRLRSGGRAVVEAFPELDGVRYNSRFAGQACVALVAPARSAMPMQPVVSLPLTHPDLGGRLAAAARCIGYRVI